MLCGRSAGEYRAYLPRARWIRDANDSYFAAMTYPQALPSSMQPADIHDATWGVLSAVYGGAVHPERRRPRRDGGRGVARRGGGAAARRRRAGGDFAAGAADHTDAGHALRLPVNAPARARRSSWRRPGVLR